MKRKLWITLVAVMMAAMLVSSALASSIYFTGNCNVRTGPGLGYASKGSVNRGSYLTYLGQSSVDERGITWYKVSFGSGSGWVSSVYGNITSASGYATYGGGASSGSSTYSGGNYYSSSSGQSVVAISGDTHVRTGPGLYYTSIGVLYRGQGVTYLNKSSVDERGVAWYNVSWYGQNAWVSSRYTAIY